MPRPLREVEPAISRACAVLHVVCPSHGAGTPPAGYCAGSSDRDLDRNLVEIPAMAISIRRAVFLGAALVLTLIAAAIRPTLAAKKSVGAPPPVVAEPPAMGQVYTIDDAHSFVEFSVRLI